MATGSQFNRVKTWNEEKGTDTDVNAEFDNVLNNLDSTGVGSGDSTAADAKLQEDPGTFASPTVATAAINQIRQLRDRISDIIGGSNSSWLDTVPTTLQTLSAVNSGAGVALEFEGHKGGASSTTDVLARFINQGGIINAASFSTADVAIADFDSTNVKFGTYSYALGSGNIMAYPGQECNPVKGTISAWFRNLAAGDYIAYNPLLGIELYCESGAGNLETKITEKGAASETTKTANTVTGASSRTADTTFRNVLMRYRLNDENGAGTDLLELEYEDAEEGTQLTAQDIDINEGDGGTWFIGAKRNDPTWDHFSAMSVLPSSEGSSPWTSNGTPNGAVSAGVLNIATTSTNTGFYSRTDHTDLTQQSIEWKSRVNSVGEEYLSTEKASVLVRDNSIDRAVLISMLPSSVSIYWGEDSDQHQATIMGNFTEYTHFRLTSSGTETADTDCTIKFYINGILMFSGTNDFTESTASDTISFGDLDASANANSNTDWEYFKIYKSGTEAPVVASSQGNIDSFGISKSVLDATTSTALQSSRFSDVLQASVNLGLQLPRTQRWALDTDISEASGANYQDFHATEVYYMMGDGVTEIEFVSTATCRSSAAGGVVYMTIDVGNDITGEAADTAVNHIPWSFMEDPDGNNDIPVTVTRSAILPVGLHEVRPQFAGDNTVRIEGQTKQFNCSIRSARKLG